MTERAMGLLANILRSTKKSRLISTATARLRAGDIDGAVDDIYAFISNDPIFARVLVAFSASKADIHALVRDLMVSGAGQTVRGHFVPISAVLFPDTLAYCLRAKRGQVPKVEAYFNILEHFRNGERVFHPERAFH